VIEDEQVRHLGTFRALAHPAEGAITAIRRSRSMASASHMRWPRPRLANMAIKC
jgi:hypothetical protein